MTRREWAAGLWIAGLGGLLFALGLAFILLPSAFLTYKEAQALKDQIQTKSLEEETAAKTLEETKQEAAAFQRELQEARARFANNQFKPRSSQEIPFFLEEFQKSLEDRGFPFLQIGYLQRTRNKGFITVPLEARIESSYEAFRQILFFIQTHPGGLHLDTLELLSLPQGTNTMKFRIQCSLRFIDKG